MPKTDIKLEEDPFLRLGKYQTLFIKYIKFKLQISFWKSESTIGSQMVFTKCCVFLKYAIE